MSMKVFKRMEVHGLFEWRGRRQTNSGWRRIIADRFKLKAVSALFPVSDCRGWSISYADCRAINNIPL